VIPQVDLVISHGGNNTVTESLHFGKPLIVLPLFWDQYENAQRIDELGFGVRLNTYAFPDTELTDAVGAPIGRHELRTRLADIVRRSAPATAYAWAPTPSNEWVPSTERRLTDTIDTLELTEDKRLSVISRPGAWRRSRCCAPRRTVASSASWRWVAEALIGLLAEVPGSATRGRFTVRSWPGTPRRASVQSASTRPTSR